MAAPDGLPPAGWAVRVTTQRLGGGEPMRTWYAAAIFLPNEAEAAVRARDGATPDEIIEAVHPISQVLLDALGIARGCVGLYPDRV